MSGAAAASARVECLDNIGGNVSYIHYSGGFWRLMSASGTPLVMSNLFGDKTALVTFALEDAETGAAVLRAIEDNAPRYRSGPKAGKLTCTYRLLGDAS